MKNKNPLLAVSALAVMALAGCGQQPADNSTPATTNSAVGQPMPGAEATNNATVAPASSPGDANNPVPTNSPALNH